ncbi:MAG: heme o synthase [Aggregatilineales bacterium]
MVTATLSAEQHGRPDSAERHSALRDYLQLTKPRIAVLLIFTTVTAMVIAAHGIPDLKVLCGTVIGGVMAASGASALNCYIDRDLDKEMSRTKARPIPAGRIAPLNALLFGIGLLAWSAFILVALVNVLTAFLALLGAVYYVIVYTMLLKRNTVLNILIGGGAGAIPVLVGWAAVMNGLGPQAFLLFAIVFYWTPPHSWALALLVNADYERAHVPMMPVARGETVTRIQILLYAAQLVVITLLPLPFRMLGLFYFLSAAALGTGLIYQSIKLIRQATKVAAKATYKYSTMYLALLFLAMIVDQLLFGH